MYHERSTQRPQQGGFTFVELAMGMVVLVIGAIVLINHLSASYSTTHHQKDRVFAFNKAQAILSEIQSYVDRGVISAAIELDALDDGVTNKPTLTITEQNGNLVLPSHPLSENYQRTNGWVWSRRITVQPFQGLNNRDVRYVTVRIYKKSQSGVDRVVASLSSVVSSAGSAFPTTQVFDVYLLAVENIPGWWVFMEAVVPFVESAITDLESRNPGLEMRTHWITKASYGRNKVYRPYINETLDSEQPVDSVYYYPGRMPAGNSSSFYYVPDIIKARMSFDGVEKGGYGPDNEYPYALADFYNHAMRLPQERAWHQKRLNAIQVRKDDIARAIANGTAIPGPLYDMSEEPTLRLFYEDLCTNPSKYRNALIINLHGELIPFPSLRNYSDPAKSPEVLDNVRVVTHPEELRTKRDGTDIDDVVLRVYAYNADGTSGPHKVMPQNNPIMVQVMGVDLTDGSNGLGQDVKIQHLEGGVNFSYAPFQDSTATPSSLGMYYTAKFQKGPSAATSYTLFELYNTPVVAPLQGNGGLDNSIGSRLYGLEYIPSSPGPVGSTPDFSHDLAVSGYGPKNTARWTIRVPESLFGRQKFVDAGGNFYDPPDDVMLEVRTRIKDPTVPTGPAFDGSDVADRRAADRRAAGQPLGHLHVVGGQPGRRADHRAQPVSGRPASQPVQGPAGRRSRLWQRLQLVSRQPCQQR